VYQGPGKLQQNSGFRVQASNWLFGVVLSDRCGDGEVDCADIRSFRSCGLVAALEAKRQRFVFVFSEVDSAWPPTLLGE
jgi:hypothetical protein